MTQPMSAPAKNYGSVECLATIKAMIEENADPRRRNDGTQWRAEGALAEVYAAVCQALPVARQERKNAEGIRKLMSEILQSVDALHHLIDDVDAESA